MWLLSKMEGSEQATRSRIFHPNCILS
jgi:hypothetical protein